MGSEGQVVDRMPLDAPCPAEADVGQTDGAPGEDGGEAAEGLHPDEGLVPGARGGEEGEKTKGAGKEDGEHGPAFAVDVGEDFGRLLLLRQRGDGAGRAVDGRVPHRQNGDHDDHVHDRVEHFDPGVGDGDDEGGCVGIRARLADEPLVRVRNEETDDRERHDVKQTDPPEDLLDRGRKRFPRVGRLGRSQAHQFGAGEGERCDHEDGTHALETIVESPRVLPRFATEITAIRATTDVEDDA